MTTHEIADGELQFSTDRSRLDVAAIHRFISDESYWTPGIARELVERAIAHSLCFGAYASGAQIGFARVVTDYVGFAYLADVFVIREWRGVGVGRRLMDFVFAHPQLQNMRRFLLATRDAHALYARYGFTPLSSPKHFMERYDADALSPARRAGQRPAGTASRRQDQEAGEQRDHSAIRESFPASVNARSNKTQG